MHVHVFKGRHHVFKVRHHENNGHGAKQRFWWLKDHAVIAHVRAWGARMMHISLCHARCRHATMNVVEYNHILDFAYTHHSRIRAPARFFGVVENRGLRFQFGRKP